MSLPSACLRASFCLNSALSGARVAAALAFGAFLALLALLGLLGAWRRPRPPALKLLQCRLLGLGAQPGLLVAALFLGLGLLVLCARAAVLGEWHAQGEQKRERLLVGLAEVAMVTSRPRTSSIES